MRLSLWVVFCLGVSIGGSSALAARASDVASQAEIGASISKGIEFLLGRQSADGAFNKQGGPGFTALATMSLLRNGRGVDDPQVAKALAYLETFVQSDGSITAPKPGITNYETCICLSCFALANKDGRYQKTIDAAARFLKEMQLDEGENAKPSDPKYGGMGYNRKSTGGDLSNTGMLMDALKASGAGPDDPAVKRALVFVSRCQNLESEHNTLPFAAKINDGGFYYSPMGEGASAAGKEEQGALRSYGSMTYDGLKSMLYAGVTASDPRVKAAMKWLADHYTVEENPGLGNAGLYYYYHLMAKALEAVGQPSFVDSSGAKHDWRGEMAAALIKRQRPDGSWTNENNRWYESDPTLATSFALLSLSYCRTPSE